MNIEIGIIGLEQSGRTTVFNALTAGAAADKAHSHSIEAHIGTAKVADQRLEVLTKLLQPKRTVPVSITYSDIGASIKGLVKDKGIGGQLLNTISSAGAIINVVRAFRDESIPHPGGGIDVERDIAAMNLELTFSDLAILEHRLERLQESLKAAKPAERQAHQKEQEILTKLKADLEKDIPIREVPLSLEESKIINNFQFLTAKPLLIVINISEDQLGESQELEAQLNTKFARPSSRVITLCGKLESELTQLAPEEAAEMRVSYGLKQPGLDRVVALSYELMGLISFFTIASGEVRAWPVQVGTEAVRAAGKIHTDMERGFIRAEVISYTDLVQCGSLSEAKKKGLLRMEGKTYLVKDGDVITFLFNV
jgi:GTP-binding protein YchF